MKRLYAFFKQQLTVTYIYEIPVRVDYRWFLVFIALTWFSATSIPDSLVENYAAKFVFGAGTILVFFVSVFLHEFAHAFVAKREGIEVLEIILHPFGGLARLRREPDTPGAEFRIAVAGPVASFVIAFVFLGLLAVVTNSASKSILTPLFFILFLLNLLLAVFNLFPGYPLDGGRVLRAFLWRRGTNLNEATILTGKFGQIIAVSLAVFGIVIILISLDVFTGLWTILVGIFLYDAASGIIRQVNKFENLIVANVMELPVSVKPETSVMQFVDTILPLHRNTIFPVAQKKELYGFLVLEDLKENLPREKWHTTKVRQVMRPVQEDYFVETGASVVEAKELLRINGIGVLGVIDTSGNFVGFLQRGRIRRRN
jgi:Zn-dependent protease/CBS domain-containing protein